VDDLVRVVVDFALLERRLSGVEAVGDDALKRSLKKTSRTLRREFGRLVESLPADGREALTAAIETSIGAAREEQAALKSLRKTVAGETADPAPDLALDAAAQAARAAGMAR